MKLDALRVESTSQKLAMSMTLFRYSVIVGLSAVIPITFGKNVGLWASLSIWSAWLAFCVMYWSRSGLSAHFDSAPGRSELPDVRETSLMLAALKRPHTVTDMILAKPVFVGFAGIGKDAQAMHLTPEVFHKNHVSLIGASGTGKSKLAALILSQLIKVGDSVVVFDPKSDEFLGGILDRYAGNSKRTMVFIDLRQLVPQINPFKNTTRAQREQILQAGLQLDPTGNPSVDFHRAEDRDACSVLVSSDADNILDLVSIGAKMGAVTERINFWRELRDLARLEAFHTQDGPDLEETIRSGGVIYIVGDTDDLRVVAAQRLLLARVLQIIKSREREGARQVALFLDEFKYMLSNVALRALGTIRDRRCNLMLAYQSYGDLEDCGALPPVAVLGAAKGNTTLKFVYKLEEAATANEFVDMAGEERISVENTQKLLQDGLEAGGWSEDTRKAVTVDMLTTNAPKAMEGEASVCWVFGLGPAFPLATMHLEAGRPPKILAAHAQSVSECAALDAQASIDIGPSATSQEELI